MRRHELDPLSLVFAAAFLLIAGSYAITHTTDARLHWLFVLPTALIVLGVAVLGASIRRMQRIDSRRRHDQTSTSTTTGA
jgi:integral membrane sensor domain MASE1